MDTKSEILKRLEEINSEEYLKAILLIVDEFYKIEKKKKPV